MSLFTVAETKEKHMAAKTAKTTPFWHQPIQGYDPWRCDRRVYRFDQATAERVCGWWESHLTLSKAGTPFILEDWQRRIVGHLFGWKKKRDDLRRYKTLWLYVPRKNGKTELGAGLAIVAFVGDGEPGAEVYSAAGDTEQAKRVYEAATNMVRRNPELDAEIEIFTGYKSMTHAASLSYWRVLSSDAGTKHGLNPHCYVIDEVHVQAKADLMEVLETGTGARRQPLGIYMTTADYARPSECNEMLAYARRVRDENMDPLYFPVIYELSENDDWHDETNWQKANPNLGVSVRWEYMRAQHRKAVERPSFENTFKRLHLNIQTSAQTKWLNVTDWDAGACDVRLADLAGERCLAAVDLSSTRDLTACGLFFHDHMYYACMFWSPAETIEKHLEYELWQQAGWLRATPGRTINSDYVAAYVEEAAARYKLDGIAYDRWNASEIAFRLGEGAGLPLEEFRQGYRSLNEPSKKLEKLLLARELKHDGSPVMRWMVANVEVLTDPAGNIKPVKPKPSSPQKVDGVVCLVMCLGLWLGQVQAEKDAMAERLAKTGDALVVLG